jgi:putative transposase
MCRVLEVSRSGYYRFLKGETYADSPLKKKRDQALEVAFWRHKRRYGSRRLRVELAEEGISIGRHRIRKSMQEMQLKAIQPKSFVPRTTQSGHGKRNSPNLLLERALPVGLNQVWISDITYLPLSSGDFGYLVTWMDLFSRKITGWQVEAHMEESMVIRALEKGLQSRKPAPGLVLHSDRGGQYVSKKLRVLMKKWKCEQSMSRADEVYDNAFAESLFSRLKAELLENGVFLSVEDARTEIFEYIEIYYNPLRRHSALGYKSPDEFEKIYHQNQSNLQVSCPNK